MMNGPTCLAPCDACDEEGYTPPIGGGTRGSKRSGVVILQRLAKRSACR